MDSFDLSIVKATMDHDTTKVNFYDPRALSDIKNKTCKLGKHKKTDYRIKKYRERGYSFEDA